MKLPLLCCALLTLAGAASGQDSAGTPAPLPSGPLLKRAPDYSTWTVTSQNGAPPKPGQTPDPGQESQPRPQGFRQAVVTKTGKIIDEKLVDGMGRQFEIWHVNGIQVTQAAGSTAPVVVPDSAGKDIYSTNFAASDFAGLDWISPQTYSGIQKVMGRDCIIFRGTVNQLPSDVQGEAKLAADRAALAAAHKAYYSAFEKQSSTGASNQPGNSSSAAAPTIASGEVSAVACIDLETRLPLVVTFGQETRTYAFGQPPTAPLQLPAACAAAFGVYQKHIANLSRVSAAP